MPTWCIPIGQHDFTFFYFTLQCRKLSVRFWKLASLDCQKTHWDSTKLFLNHLFNFLMASKKQTGRNFSAFYIKITRIVVVDLLHWMKENILISNFFKKFFRTTPPSSFSPGSNGTLINACRPDNSPCGISFS